MIVGHLDTVDGPAVFAALPQIRRGMTIEVAGHDGVAHGFETIGVADVAKTSFPAQAVYAPSRKPTLALITCSGRFDETTGHYENNLIILARASKDRPNEERSSSPGAALSRSPSSPTTPRACRS